MYMKVLLFKILTGTVVYLLVSLINTYYELMYNALHTSGITEVTRLEL